MEIKKCVIIPMDLHKKVKAKAVEDETTIENIIKDILKKEFDQNGK